jgi:prepilin peptidase CpaA
MTLPILTLPAVVVLGASLAAAVTDVRSFRIPNRLTLPLLACGLVYQLVTAGLSGLGAGLLGVLLGFALLVPFHVAGGLGAGDVKLLAAVGAWLRPALTFQVFVASAFGAGLYAIVLLLVTRRGPKLWDHFQTLWIRLILLDFARRTQTPPVQELVGQSGRRTRLIPFGLLVAVGLVVTLVRSA